MRLGHPLPADGLAPRAPPAREGQPPRAGAQRTPAWPALLRRLQCRGGNVPHYCHSSAVLLMNGLQ